MEKQEAKDQPVSPQFKKEAEAKSIVFPSSMQKNIESLPLYDVETKNKT